MDDPAEDLVGELLRWLAEARVDAAAASRARERWLRQQQAEDATVAGILLDLAESQQPVSILASTGRRHVGLIRAVAEDFSALRSAGGRDVLVASDAIVSVQAHHDAPVASGSRPAALALALVDALAALAADRPRLLFGTRDGSLTAGELQSVGQDVVVVRPDGEPRATYLPVAGLSEVTVLR